MRASEKLDKLIDENFNDFDKDSVTISYFKFAFWEGYKHGMGNTK